MIPSTKSDTHRNAGPAKAGIMLSSARKTLRLRYRDVQAASRRIARSLGREFAIPMCSLAAIESGRSIPTLYRLSSLCAVYHLAMPQVLKWYGPQIPQPVSRFAA